MQVSSITGKQADVRTFQPDDRLILPTCYVGVESEVEGVRIDRIKAPKYWNVVEDGSLRKGAEFVLSEPLMGVDLITSLENLEKAGQDYGVVQSVRTSVHVHVDARDMSLRALLNLIGLYLIIEKVIYRYHDHGYNRHENIYCLPFYNATRHLEYLGGLSSVLKLAEGEESQDVARNIQHHLQNLNKYYGLNVAALFNFGSLEFRHMEGSTNSEGILEWINILMAMKKYACSYEGHPYEMLTGISGAGYMSVIGDVFSKDVISKLFNYPEVDDDILDGMRIFQDMIYAGDLNDSSNNYMKAVVKKNPNFKESDTFKNLLKKRKPKGEKVKSAIGGIELHMEQMRRAARMQRVNAVPPADPQPVFIDREEEL